MCLESNRDTTRSGLTTSGSIRFILGEAWNQIGIDLESAISSSDSFRFTWGLVKSQIGIDFGSAT